MASERPNRVILVASLLALVLALLGSGAAAAETPPPPDPPGDIDPDRFEPSSAVGTAAAEVRAIRFPVKGRVSYVDTFGACRDGCSRQHMGTDIFGSKLQPLVAARDGWVTWVRTDASGTSGNGLAVTDAQGWRYLYLHVNNDTPGTDDGRNPARYRFAPGVSLGTKVYAGQHIAYLGDSGNAETTPPHLHFEIRRPDGVTINPYPSLRAASTRPPDPRLYLFDEVRGGTASDHIAWGAPTNTVLACDLDGDGEDEPVVHDGRVFTWAEAAEDGAARRQLVYGSAGDAPLCGDWDGDGTDTIGVRRGRLFLLRDTNSAGPADRSFSYGREGDVVVVGDWDGNGADGVGVVRGHLWHLIEELRAGPADHSFGYGRPTDIPLVGDWDGDGDHDPGIRRNRTTMMRFALAAGPADLYAELGQPSDIAIAARWDVTEGPGDAVSLWRPYPA